MSISNQVIACGNSLCVFIVSIFINNSSNVVKVASAAFIENFCISIFLNEASVL